MLPMWQRPPSKQMEPTVSRKTRKSNSLFYGAPVSANAFPTYSTADLQRDLDCTSLDADTRTKIVAEIARRSLKRSRKTAGGGSA